MGFGDGSSEIKVNITGDSHGGVVAVEDMRAELERLNAEVAQLSAHQAAYAGGGESFASSLQQMGLSFGTLGFQVGGLNVNLGAMLSQMGVLGEVAGPAGLAVAMITGIGSQVMGVADGFERAADRALQFAETLAGQAMQQGLQYVEQFGQQMFQLNEQTEKNFFNWTFLWGGIDQSSGTGPGLGPATQLAQWSKQASLYMPFNRQDLMGAVTTASITSGQSVGDVEHDLDLLSDVASTQGRPGLTLSWASMAALRGQEGYSRMLLMDLNLNKSIMEKYGFVDGEDGTFFPALEAYLKDKGSLGASKYIATHTFWGAQTSLQDRLQNFALDAGGWNDSPTSMDDDVKKGSLFWYLKQDLVGASNWMSQHQKDVVDPVSNTIGQIGGGLLGGAGSIFGGIFDAMDKSGIAADLMKQLTRFGSWLNDPQTQKALHDFGDLIGNVVAPGLKDVGTVLDTFASAFGGSGIGQDILGTLGDLSRLLKDPETQKALAALGDALGKIAGSGAKDVFDALKEALAGLGASGAGQTLLKDLQGLGTWLADPKHQDDIQKFAYTVGVFLGDEFVVASDAVKMLIDDLSMLAQLLSKEGDAFDALRHGDFGRLAHDDADILNILKQLQTTTQADEQKIGADAKKLIQDFLQGKPGTAHYALTGPIGAQRAQDAAIAAGTATPSSGGAVDGYSSDFSSLGSQNAQDYLTGFHTTLRDQSGPDLVTAFTDGVNRQLSGSSGAGDLLAQRLATFIDQRTRQAIADALANMDITSNGSRTQAGGPGHAAFTPY